MNHKFFAYDPEAGFETFGTAEMAKAAAQESIDCYRENACEGWDESIDHVCWGEISESAEQFGMGEKIHFDGELVEAVDYKLTETKSPTSTRTTI